MRYEQLTPRVGCLDDDHHFVSYNNDAFTEDDNSQKTHPIHKVCLGETED